MTNSVGQDGRDPVEVTEVLHPGLLNALSGELPLIRTVGVLSAALPIDHGNALRVRSENIRRNSSLEKDLEHFK